jgi:predicted nuclease with TOPRIM domain
MLRDQQLAILQDVERRGRELLERYRSLSGDARESLGPQRLDRIVTERRRLLDRLARRIAERRELPSEGNRDKAHLESLSDRLLAGTGADDTLVERLRRAEADYRDQVDAALEEDWDDAERRCLHELREHIDATVAAWSA